MMPSPVEASDLLSVSNLQVEYLSRRGSTTVVRGVSFELRAGRTLGLVGESGSGKSVTVQALLGLLRSPGYVSGGDVVWKGRHVIRDGRDAGSTITRGSDAALIFQDPMTSLDPLMTVGRQIEEAVKLGVNLSAVQSKERVLELLTRVKIGEPQRRYGQYPHELSGGMRQRALIAMALAGQPDLLIADEPTTALDVTVQAQILDLLEEIQARDGLGILFITHDLGVVARLCHDVAVMYAGRIVEYGPVDTVFSAPRHPYTAALLRATPDLSVSSERLTAIPGSPPQLDQLARGCSFEERCSRSNSNCASAPSSAMLAGVLVECHNPLVSLSGLGRHTK